MPLPVGCGFLTFPYGWTLSDGLVTFGRPDGRNELLGIRTLWPRQGPSYFTSGPVGDPALHLIRGSVWGDHRHRKREGLYTR